MADHAIKACLITNPKSGRGGVDLSEVLMILRGQGWDVTVRQKLKGDYASKLAQDAAREGCNVVVDCAGDGTLSEIVEGVVGTDAAVGAIPGGTANLWAHEVGISRRLAVAAMQLVASERRRVDVGYVEVNSGHGQHFLLVAGIGLDGAIVGRVNKRLKNRIGPLAVGLAAVEALPSFHAVPVRIEMDGVHWQGRVSQIVLGNTRRYAGFTHMTPDAFMDDGLLDVCLITAKGAISASRQLGALVLRQHPSPASAETYRAASVSVHSPVALPLELDGGTYDMDNVDPTADGVVYTFSVVAQGVTMLVPRTYDGALFQPNRLADTLTLNPLTPVDPAADDANGRAKSNGRQGQNGHKTHGHKRKDWQVQVLEVGVDTITAARVKNGKVVKVVVDPHTLLDDGNGERSLWGTLSTITPGELLEVAGRKDQQQGTLVAERVTLHDYPKR